MIYVCVICMVKRPPLSPLSAEHRTLLELIVSPVINRADFQAFHCQWLVCDSCKLLMQTLYNFRQTALAGVKNLLLYLKTGPTVIEETKPIVHIKLEPTPEISAAASKDKLITINEPRNVNLLTEELDMKLEPAPIDSKHEPEVERDCDTVSPASSESSRAPSDIQPATSISPEQQATVTEQVWVPNTQQVWVPNTQQVWVPNTQQIQVPNTQQIQVPNTQQIQVPNTQQIRVPNTQQIQVPNTQQIRVPNTQQARVPNTQQIQVPNTQQPVIADSDGNFEVFTHQQPVGKNMAGQRPKKGKYIRKKPPFVTCPHCGKSISGEFNLKSHVTRLHGEISLRECDVCGKQCRNEMSLKSHKRIHTRIKNKPSIIDSNRPELFCKECCKQFSSPSTYKIHLATRKHTPKERYTFECERCKAKFLDEQRLQQHINIVHLHLREYKCDKCDKSYGSPAAVRSHNASTHEKRLKPSMICHLCGKTFMIRKSLKEHLLMHEGLRPHKCPLCPATFTYEAALFTHNRLKHLKIKRKKKKVEKEGGEKVESYDGVRDLLKII